MKRDTEKEMGTLLQEYDRINAKKRLGLLVKLEPLCWFSMIQLGWLFIHQGVLRGSLYVNNSDRVVTGIEVGPMYLIAAAIIVVGCIVSHIGYLRKKAKEGEKE